MLRFAHKPDQLFLLLFNDAIEFVLRQLNLYGERHAEPADLREFLSDTLPRSAELFTFDLAVEQLKALQAANAQPQVVQPTDYHWLLLYEMFEFYCEMTEGMPTGPLYNQYGITDINFDALIDFFFWDTDFLDRNIPNLPLEKREAMDISPETFGLTAGLPPHPEELQLKPCDDEMTMDFFEAKDLVFREGATTYPSFQ
jgi:hypothetical protein